MEITLVWALSDPRSRSWHDLDLGSDNFFPFTRIQLSITISQLWDIENVVIRHVGVCNDSKQNLLISSCLSNFINC